MTHPDTVGARVVRVPARVHLAGNPSDGYGGAVLSTVVPDLSATVRATPADRFSVAGPIATWDSLAELRAEVGHVGHDGGDRLVTAALVTLDRLLPAEHARPRLAIDWSTDIPRSVGLGGSSAIVVATMRAALGCWGLEIPPHELAEAALLAETDELGIAAGLADRVAQVLETTVLTDCRGAEPVITPVPVPPASAVELTLAWSPAAAAPSGDYHADLRARLAQLRERMARLAQRAEDAARALAEGDRARFAEELDASLRDRCALGPVPEAALAPVPAIRAAGGAVNFAGSGGAIVVHPVTVPVPQGWVARTIRL